MKAKKSTIDPLLDAAKAAGNRMAKKKLQSGRLNHINSSDVKKIKTTVSDVALGDEFMEVLD